MTKHVVKNLHMSHVGIHVHDMDKELKFYTEVMGFHQMDFGTIYHPSLGESTVAFLSRDPAEHHQLALFSGRPETVNFNVVQQISMNAGSLQNVRDIASYALKNGASQPMPMSHGHTISCYILDPEGNRLEIYFDLDWYAPQPYVTFIPDFFDVEEKELIARVYAEASQKKGFVEPKAKYTKMMEEAMGIKSEETK
ncbi:Glyoxalase/Bleomycin resistance protein/Dihydroxybiphenyl dioxygenase [Gonapodya prolifera JEL478]|uniref:Glyoxalase/Bleomycin resistance protein/Dihydroxybiphenyl dioxygenase n=1 Tax=Gonapodya prolifera (strain JEL478) TaxID=1344416 RepID=A0A138ZYD4_GONPJ|nr:Glyoxalase/Bleomycin resistance protein/Dihydroxybiphenyl dioxygenase [Gonapodya prolifera JEL478]|eukprot:KXS09509.1 Glyoxalase/Bleomycin resistance protein/Dihydroxybiphenyl dioxygenase [Gonapodya prolifera JEL478]